MKLKRFLISFSITLGLIYLLANVAVFFAIRYKLTDTEGMVDPNNDKYQKVAVSANEPIGEKEQDQSVLALELKETQTECKLSLLEKSVPINARLVRENYQKFHSFTVFEKMLLAIKIKLAGNEFETAINNCEKDPPKLASFVPNPAPANIFDWINKEEWGTAKAGIVKDRQKIDQAANQAGISSRLIVSVLTVEQLRLFYDQREVYEKVFKPLQILSTANKMAWGVMSIKEDTAITVEQNLKNPASSSYLGPGSEHLLDFQTQDPTKERYDRLTNDKDHYYAYLYGALALKQLETQWRNAGHDISDRPEILATLYNLGLSKSKPKENPQVGGSKIPIGDYTYTFGSLAYEFFYSGELDGEFPL